jgi:hypothetical protein
MGIGRCATITAIALVVYSTGLWAECWTPPPPCAAMTQNSVVVLAEVLDATFRSAEPLLDVRLRVLEPFKGVEDHQAEIEMNGILLTAETITLVKGQTYLIYANVYPSGIWGTACSRTRKASADGPADELLVLRQCRSDLAKGQR